MPSIRTYPMPEQIVHFLNHPDFSLVEMSKRLASHRGGTPSASYLLLCKARQPGKKFTATSIAQLARLVKSYTDPSEKDVSVNLRTNIDRSWSRFPSQRSTMPSPSASASPDTTSEARPLETVPPVRSETRMTAAQVSSGLDSYAERLDKAASRIADSATRIASILAPDTDEFEKKLADIEKLIAELREGAKSSRLQRTG